MHNCCIYMYMYMYICMTILCMSFYMHVCVIHGGKVNAVLMLESRTDIA